MLRQTFIVLSKTPFFHCDIVFASEASIQNTAAAAVSTLQLEINPQILPHRLTELKFTYA